MRTEPLPIAAARTPAAGIVPSAVVAAVATAAALAAGCGGSDGPSRIPISGTVTVDGAPLPAGTVTLVPVDDTPGGKVAGAIADGQYAVPPSVGPVPGTYRVEIVAESPDEPPAGVELSPDELARLKSNPPSRPQPLPTIYNIASTLRRELPAEGDRLDFALTRSP